ncbi:lasso RiPP family leader peptide-containing protein [Symbioplanes lichenis]|nr:lasso RiPP family leader peptide-containing protein [Actinoplanes lichenis]
MTDHSAVYEPPALVELGDFTDVTLGYFFGLTPDWLVRFFNLCPTGC